MGLVYFLGLGTHYFFNIHPHHNEFNITNYNHHTYSYSLHILKMVEKLFLSQLAKFFNLAAIMDYQERNTWSIMF